MSINGTGADFDELRGIVMRHDSELSNLTGVAALVRKVVDQVNRIERLVNDLDEWKSDSKVQHINALQGRVKSLQWEKEEAKREAARDRLDLKRTMRAAIITGVITLIVGYLAAKFGVHP
jgi:hypothetical protein